MFTINRFRRPAALLLVMLVLPMVGCSTNPATGKSQLNFLSQDDEIRMGSEAEPEFLKEGGGELPDKNVVRYVSDLGHKLAAVSERKDLPWEFHVLNTDMINAFALPGGKVFMTRGLMEKMTNEAQLAGVLGHEIGHVTAQHIGQQMSRAMVVQGLIVGAGVATDQQWIGTLGGAGGGLYLLKFGRDQESQADELGVRYMVKLGYDPRGQVQVMRILREASGGGEGIEMLQTHPLPSTRIDELRELIEREYAYTRKNPQYRLDEESFRRNALEPLAKLPPAPKPKNNK